MIYFLPPVKNITFIFYSGKLYRFYCVFYRIVKKTAGVTGGFIALALACRKLVDEGRIAENPIRNYVTGVSAGIVDDTAMLDLQYYEDSSAQVDLNCVMNELGEIIELQGTGEGRAFTLDEQQELVRLCAKGNKELLKIQKEILEG